MDDILSSCSHATFNSLNNSSTSPLKVSVCRYQNGTAIAEPDSIEVQALTRIGANKRSQNIPPGTNLELQHKTNNFTSSDFVVSLDRTKDSHQTGISKPTRKECSHQPCCRQSNVHKSQRSNNEPSSSRSKNCSTEVRSIRPAYMRSISQVMTESEIQHRVEQFARNIEMENLSDPCRVNRPQPLEFYCRRFDKRLRKVNQWLVIKKRIQRSKKLMLNSSSPFPGSVPSTSILPATESITSNNPEKSPSLTPPKDISTCNTNIDTLNGKIQTGQPPHSVCISLDSEDDTFISNSDHMSNTQESSVNSQPIFIHNDSEDETNGNARGKSDGESDHSRDRDRFLIIVDSDEELSANDIEIHVTSNSGNKSTLSKEICNQRLMHRSRSLPGVNSSKETIIYVDSDDNVPSDTTETNRRCTPSSNSDVIEVTPISDSEDESIIIQENGKPLVPDNTNNVSIKYGKETGITHNVSRLQKHNVTKNIDQGEQTQAVLKVTARPKRLRKRKSRVIKKCCRARSNKLLKNLKEYKYDP